MAIAVMALAAAQMAPVDYRLSVAQRRDAGEVTVAMTFSGDADGVTDIDLPDRWAGVGELWRNLGPPVVTGGRRVAGTPGTWRIAHRPNARVTVRYVVRDGEPGLPGPDFEKARPVVERDWFHLLGQGAIAIPVGRDEAPATFRWGSIAKGWRVASDLERTATPLTATGVAEGVVIGGTALRLSTRTVGGAPLRVAMLGHWSYTDAALADAVARLMTVENALLAAPAIPYFVSVMPLTGSERGALSYGGTGRTAGFQIASTDNIALPDLSRTLAHEYAHRWFGHGFGTVAEGAGPYWFTEGVNDWFAARAMRVAGLWTPADWARSVNDVLLRYGSSTARDLTDAQVTDAFWRDPDAMQVQYDRGHLTALLLDRRLDGGLAGILRGMAAQPSREDQVTRFIAAAGADAVAQARAAASRTLAADALAACGRIASVTQPRYDRGYDSDAGGVVTAVRTPAARTAGIRVGMRAIRRLAFVPGDSAGLYSVRFADGSDERTIDWYPRGETSVTFQRLDATTADTPGCRLLIAGAVAGARATP